MTQLSLQDALALALRHHQSGQLQEAERVYRLILQQVPNQPDALHLLGVVAHQVGRHDVAIELIRKAIDPGGLKNASTFNNLGEAYRATRQFKEAEACFRQSIAHEPAGAGAHSNLGIVLQELRGFDEAEVELREALRLQPDFVEAMNNLGNLFIARGNFDEAEKTLRRAIERRPDYAEAHNNLGTVFEKVDRYDESLAEYRRAIELKPAFVEAVVNLGSLHQKLGQVDSAVECWQRAIQLNPQHADAHWNIGLASLARGDYVQGWKLYEARFACNHSRQYWREYPKPRWDGKSDLRGKTILLYSEQGFGDVIQFARFVPIVASRGGRVILECHGELVELMKSLEGVAEVTSQLVQADRFDTFQAMLSVPSVLAITLHNLPANVPYLRATGARREEWPARVRGAPGEKKVGIVWSGKPIPDPKRTCSLNDLTPLFDLPGIRWFSLQAGEAAAALAQIPEADRPIDIGASLKDFADTAAVLSQLDLLITIDTAAAHLAGAMGVPTWTMVPFAPDWRWMYDREDCPWYPTMRIFRQPKINDWKAVVSRIRTELANFTRE